MYGQGPPPNPPTPQVQIDNGARAAARETKDAAKKATDLVREAEDRAIRISRRKALAAKTSGPDSTRFWKKTSVEPVKDDEGHLHFHLDSRPLRHPTTKKILQIPAHKKLLAHALATEWDGLASVKQATQGHRVPLTSLVCRAVDLAEEAAAVQSGSSDGPMRKALIENLLRYLDTDSLLCWAPPDELAGLGAASTRFVAGHGEVTLRQLQEKTAGPILEYMTTHVWPGVVVEPVLGGEDQASLLFPKAHPAETRTAVGAWLEQLNGWDLAGVERATLAGKSMVVASRLVAGWSPTATATAANGSARSVEDSALSVEDAFAATNMETAFQTAQWGEVEDTHDVEQADMRRHFGSVVLLVS